MRVQFLQSFDFNQMLVFSVFVHLLLLTGVLFLPKPTFLEKTVVPAFMVNLVSQSTGFKAAPSKRLEPKVRKKSIEKKIAPKKGAKKSSAPTVVKKSPPVKMPNKALEALSKLEGKAVLTVPNVVEELDQVARLEKAKVKPKGVIKQKPIAEKTFRELETLRNKKVLEKQVVAPVPLPKDILEDFEELKMKENLPETPASLEKQLESVPESKEPEKPKAPEVDLLKELELLAKLDASPVLVPDVEKEVSEIAKEKQKSSESYDPIIEKLGALSVDSELVKVEISRVQITSSSFQSKLRNLPKASPPNTEPGKEDSFVLSENEGNPGADAQSLHVGIIQEKVFQNWREPLAQEYNREAVVSFYIFSQGNIDKPFVKKSSGVETLDTLAVRAVLDSAPFPEFPKELKMSNFRIEMHFKYVPKDK
jgi:TonB family protein